MPFEIPTNWYWCKLGNVVNILNGDRGKNYPCKSKLKDVGNIPFISASNIENNTIKNQDLKFLTNEQYNILKAGQLEKGDLVLCIRGSLGKNGIFSYNKGAIASSLVIIRGYDKKRINNNFVSHYFDSQLFKDEINNYDNGTAQPNLSAENVKNFCFPLPPLAEQQRIVEKLDKIMPEIDAISQSMNELEKLSK